MQLMTDKIVILTTCDTPEEAERIARALVEAHLAACVNVVAGARSFYRWKGAVEEAAEWLLLIKSSRELFESVRTEIAKQHSYELPELIALQVVEGSDEYLEWMTKELRVL